MKESGLIIKHMDLELTNIILELFTKAIGIKIFKVELG
jgi:hypothetical protein